MLQLARRYGCQRRPSANVIPQDLVTLRDPTSPYTFLNYLKEVGLLDRFVHLNTCHPSRDWYRRYLDWVAKRFDAVISYNTFADTIVATPGGYNLTVIDGQTRTRWLRGTP